MKVASFFLEKHISIDIYHLKNCLNNLETNEKIYNLYLLQVQAYLNAIIYTLYIILKIILITMMEWIHNY